MISERKDDMKKFYEMQVAGLTRRLPLCRVNEDLNIAAFVMFGDVELTVRCRTSGKGAAVRCAGHSRIEGYNAAL